tara:strand:- start:2665 stop:3219 length:555 start_codon:yes stop_codon:yes gene_type:complete
MKLIRLFKNIPFLLTLFIIILLNISNQKQYTKLKILIWNTPSLSLGTYLALSCSSGFIISYIITTNLANGKKVNIKKELKYRVDNKKEETNLQQQTYNDIPYSNTFIERDVKDPSPTINASFRVIGQSNRNDKRQQKYNYDDYESSDLTDELNSKYDEQEANYKNEKGNYPILNDWDDYSDTDW